MATSKANEPYGNTPLRTEDLATLGHPLSASDFNQDADGRLWRVIRGTKTYYSPDWFDKDGTYTGYKSQANDPTGQDEGFFHTGTKWNWEKGQYENPTNWANVIGSLAAGGVGAGVAAPFIAGALGGGAAGGAGGASAGGGGLGSSLASSATAGITHGGASALLTNPLVTGGVKNIVDAARGQWSPADLASLVPTGSIAGAVTNNPLARAALTSGLNTGVRAATTGQFDPKAAGLDLGTSLVGPTARGLTSNPYGRAALTSGLQTGLRSAATGQFDPANASLDLGTSLVAPTARSVTDNPLLQRGLTAGGTTAINTARGKPLTPGGIATSALNVVQPPGPVRRSPSVIMSLNDDGGGDGTPNKFDLGEGDAVNTTPRPWHTLNYWDDPNADGGDAGDSGGWDPNADGGDVVDGGWDPNSSGWPSNDNVGLDPGDAGDDGVLPSRPTVPVYGPLPGPLPSTNVPPDGSLPSGGSGSHPSVGVPLPSGGGGSQSQEDLYQQLLKALGGKTDIAGLITQGLGGFLSGLGQSMFQQKRQSFKGTAADPERIMGDIGTGLKGLLGGFQDRYNAGVSLPDAFVSTKSPVFTGGGMAMPVGILPTAGDVGLNVPVSLDAKGIVRRDPGMTPGLSTQTPDVKLPGSTPGMQYPLLDPGGPFDQHLMSDPASDKQRALSALSLLGVGGS